MVKKGKKIGLALGGGGAKGFVHIGVIKALEYAGVPIDYVAGTSMGAIVGGWYAAKKDIGALEEIVINTKRSDLFPLSELIKKKDGSLFRGDAVYQMLKKYLGDTKIEDCRIPFAAVATDTSSGKEIRLVKGNLADAIRASIALPVLLAPVEFQGRMLSDGGMSNPVPADVVREMGADYVIAVDVSSPQMPQDGKPESAKDMYSVFTDAIAVLEYQVAKHVLDRADIVMRPPIFHYGWMDFDKGSELISIGKQEAELNINEILKDTGRRKTPRSFAEKFLDFILNKE